MAFQAILRFDVFVVEIGAAEGVADVIVVVAWRNCLTGGSVRSASSRAANGVGFLDVTPLEYVGS